MNKLNKSMRSFYPVIGSLLTVVAIVGGIKPYSFWSLYQPKAPKCLK